MRLMRDFRLGGLAFWAVGIAALAPARADSVADFYRGKTITLVISVGEGDGMDQAARMIAAHWTSHIPGHPIIVAKNMPGAGSLRATNFLYNQAPRDGTAIGAIIPAFVLQQILKGSGVTYDASKFGWIDSSNTSNGTIYVWHTAGVKTLEDAMGRPVVVGATGAGSNSAQYPTILDNVLGTKFKIVMGYRSSPEINLAVERGEVQGRAGESFNTLMLNDRDWITQKKIDILVQIGRTKEPGFESIPLLTDFAKDRAKRAVLRVFSDEVALGRPYLVPPGVPPERLAALRQSLEATLRDPATLADAKKIHLDILPTKGTLLHDMVDEMILSDDAVLAGVRSALELNGAVERKAH